ncbi:MAG: hypothetical protein LDL31_13600 [Prosthecobacter sp.]|nr:hypothetical protein [Prosthecobacter sp.]
MPTPPKKNSNGRDLDQDGDVDLADNALLDLNRDGRIDANDREGQDLDNDQDIDAADRSLKAAEQRANQSVGASLGWQRGGQGWNKPEAPQQQQTQANTRRV